MTARFTVTEPDNPSFTNCPTTPFSFGNTAVFNCPNGDGFVGKFVVLTQLVVLLPWEVFEVEIYGIWAESNFFNLLNKLNHEKVY